MFTRCTFCASVPFYFIFLIKTFAEEQKNHKNYKSYQIIRNCIDRALPGIHLMPWKHLKKIANLLPNKKKEAILFLKAIKSYKQGNKCILIRVKLLVNELALGCCKNIEMLLLKMFPLFAKWMQMFAPLLECRSHTGGKKILNKK